MTDYPRGSEPPTGITVAAMLRWDAQMLQDAMLEEAIRTSPDSFLITYGSCSSLSRHLVGVGVPALVGLLGPVLVAASPQRPGVAVRPCRGGGRG